MSIHLHNRIFLVGFMGVGKTTVARKLGEVTKLDVIDLDHFIEQRYFKTIAELFSQEGEDGFRAIEHKILKELTEVENVIISTGGGAPCFFNNMDLMNAAGQTVFIDLPVDLIAERLLSSKTERPLIKGKTPEELKAFIASKLEDRRPFYSKAKITINPADKSPEDICKMIYPEN